MEIERSPYNIVQTIYKIIKLLPTQKSRLFWILLFFMLVGAGFEAFTLCAIAILASGLSDPDTLIQSSYYAKIQSFYTIKFIETAPGLISTISIVVVILVTIRNILIGLTRYAGSRYAAFINGYIGQRLLMGFLRAPYEWHLSQNSADLVTTVNWRQFFGNAINASLMVLSDLIIVASMMTVLIIVEPQISLIVIGVISVISFLIFFRLKGFLDRTADKCRTLSKSIGRHVTKALHGVKDVKIYGKHHFFASDYEHEVHSFARLEALQQILTQSPVLLLEISGFAMLSLSICLMLFIMDASLSQITGTLALLAVTAWRVLPAVSRILRRLTHIRVLLPYVHNGFTYLSQIKHSSEDISDTDQMGHGLAFKESIQINDISFSYRKATAPALSDIRFVIPKGKSIGIIGPSGSGKSTLVDILIGLLLPSNGFIEIDHRQLTRSDHLAWRHKVGYVSQFPYIYDGTLAENVAFGLKGNQIDRQRVMDCCQMAHMEDFLKNLCQGIDTNIGERGLKLSGGQRQRVAIARALYCHPEILIFDEATSSLDSESEQAIQKTIYSLKGKQTLVIIAHRLSTVEDCDSLIWLEGGKLVQAGSPHVILPNYNNRRGATSA
jgi:ABC-type multidrug transport system fused ATPase/permease subunit